LSYHLAEQAQPRSASVQLHPCCLQHGNERLIHNAPSDLRDWTNLPIEDYQSKSSPINRLEDNQGCISGQRPQDVPRNKYLSLKYFFRDQIEKKRNCGGYIKSDSKADIFTKGLPSVDFKRIRGLLIGW
jgi:hypothetical protein